MITRIYSGEDGRSYFQDIEQPMLYPIGNKQFITKPLANGDCRIFEFASDFVCDWHLSLKPAYYIYIQGAQEVEVSSGEKRNFGAGDIILAEDTHGIGHRSRSISSVPGRALIVFL